MMHIFQLYKRSKKAASSLMVNNYIHVFNTKRRKIRSKRSNCCVRFLWKCIITFEKNFLSFIQKLTFSLQGHLLCLLLRKMHNYLGTQYLYKKMGFQEYFCININTDTNISRGLKLKLSRERYYIYGMIVCLFLWLVINIGCFYNTNLCNLADKIWS